MRLECPGQVCPLCAGDHVRATDDVSSYELDGELRLAQSMGEVVAVELTDDALGGDDDVRR